VTTNESLLREFIRESAVSISTAKDQHLALAILGSDVMKTGERMYVLYDAGLMDDLRQGTVLRDAPRFLHHVVGMIRVRDFPDQTAPSWGATEVINSAARLGYGPLLYDIVMSREGRIMSDRGFVSSSALRVWKYYRDRRPDVKKLPLDDVEDPKTTPVVDDAELHVVGSGDIETDAVNYAYFGGDIDATPLTKSHESAIVESEVHSSDYERALEDATAAFFLLMISRTS
jgi:hypothetical protein